MKVITTEKTELNITTQKDELGNIQSSLDYFLKFDIPKNFKILDIGCNYGSLISNLYNLGYKNVFGVEIDTDAVEKGKQYYPSISNNLMNHQAGNLPFDHDSFDVILMFDVIEHISNIKLFLKEEVFRVLKNGGNFIFQTPNKYINIPWEIINQRSFSKYKNYHCSLQTTKSLKELLVSTNFTSINLEKGNIMSEHNRNKVYKKAGYFGIMILQFLKKLPLVISPNLWGNCKK